MSKQVLSIEQMQHLKELGLDTSNASMVLIYKDDEGNELEWDEVEDELSHPEPMELFRELYDAETGNYDHSYKKYCGVFTLQDILDILPICINEQLHIFDPKLTKFELRIKRMVSHNGKKVMYAVLYEDSDDINWYIMQSRENLIDAAYEMLCWCIESGYVKTNKI